MFRKKNNVENGNTDLIKSHITVKAKIQFLSFEEGGRKHPIAIGERYNPIVRFTNCPNEDHFDHATWSAHFITTDLTENEMNVDFGYLRSDVGPVHLLKSGNEFDLFEGGKKVAHGVIL